MLKKAWVNRRTWAGLIIAGSFHASNDRLRFVIHRWMDGHKKEIVANWDQFAKIIDAKEVQEMFTFNMKENEIISQLDFVFDYAVLK